MSDWIKTVDQMPASGRTVLAYYANALGMSRIIRAAWLDKYSEECDAEDDIGEYCEGDDAYYWPEGWYEQIDNWDDYTAVAVYQGEITHWMPLPKLPEQP